jgi:hypothetical protein
MHTYTETMKEQPRMIELMQLESSPFLSTIRFAYKLLWPMSTRPKRFFMVKVILWLSLLTFL